MPVGVIFTMVVKHFSASGSTPLHLVRDSHPNILLLFYYVATGPRAFKQAL
jgi:hypothetical protein